MPLAEISYFVSFYCPKCKSHISESVTFKDTEFDMVEAFNHVADRNVRGSGKAIGKCNYPGTGHIIQGLTLTGIKQRIAKPEENNADD